MNSIVFLIALIMTMVIGPTLTVECAAGFECEALVCPNTYSGPLVLAVDGEYLLKWEEITTSSCWGVRLWFGVPRCVGRVARMRLLVEGIRETEIAQEVLSEECSFLPAINK